MPAEPDHDATQSKPLAQSVFDASLLVIIGMLAAKLMWLFVAPAEYVAKPVSISAQSAGPVAGQLVAASFDTSILSGKNPFIGDGAIALSGGADAQLAPETNLDVKLKGIRHSTDQERGGAFVELSTGEEAFVRVGDEIAGNVVVDRILPNQIILRRNGALESLHRRTDEDQVLIAYTGQERSEPRVLFSGTGDTVATNSGSASRATGGGPVEGARAGRSSNGRSQASQTVRTEVGDPSVLLNSVQFSPITEGSKITGYSVSPRGDPGPMQDAGFQSGDVIRAINSRPVSQLDERELLDLLSFSRRLRFNLLRDGAAIQIIVTITGAN